MSYFSLGPSNDMPYSTAVVTITATTGTVVSSVTGSIIRVYAVVLGGTAATAVTFQDSVGAFSGAIQLALGVPLVLPNTGTPWFISAPGASFQIVNTVTTLGGTVWYTQNKFGG